MELCFNASNDNVSYYSFKLLKSGFSAYTEVCVGPCWRFDLFDYKSEWGVYVW